MKKLLGALLFTIVGGTAFGQSLTVVNNTSCNWEMVYIATDPACQTGAYPSQHYFVAPNSTVNYSGYSAINWTFPTPPPSNYVWYEFVAMNLCAPAQDGPCGSNLQHMSLLTGNCVKPRWNQCTTLNPCAGCTSAQATLSPAPGGGPNDWVLTIF